MSVPVQQASLEQLERLVFAREHEEAARCLLQVLARMRRGQELVPPRTEEAARLSSYARLAAAIVALVADPEFRVSHDGFMRFVMEHRTFDAVFQASAFETSDHLVRQFGQPAAGRPDELTFPSEVVVKALMSYSLASALDLEFEEVLKIAPALAPAWILALLAHICVISEAAHGKRERLLGLGSWLERAPVNEHMINNLQDAYMHCSYASAPTKHAIKRSLNIALGRFVQEMIAIPAPQPRRQSERPTLVVPLERFDSMHAMYRCYAPSVGALRGRFKVVALGPTWALDAVARELFDEVIDLGPTAVVEEAVRAIAGAKPDLIYYPSVGMASWCVALAATRLAPVQLFTMGHPATTQSPAMDYAIVPELTPGAPSGFSETVVLVSGFVSMLPVASAQFPVGDAAPNPPVLRIAVPSMAAKLNAPFMRVCSNVVRRAGRRIEFHFFPNMHGVHAYQTYKAIRKWVPDAVVHPPVPYNDYLMRLKECHVHLSTFPFGGTNSNFDSMKLGIPIVTLEGGEVHGQTDAAMMRLAGLPEWLITHDPAAYEEAALRLVGDDALRTGLRAQLLARDVQSAFVERPAHAYTQDFCEAVHWLYQQHEEIQSSGRRYWTVAERRAHKDHRPHRSGA